MSARFTAEDLESMEEDDAGACIECGEWAYNVEPDSHAFECQNCGSNAVYGSEQLVALGLIDYEDE